MVFRNNGSGEFIAEPLPFLSQMAPIMDLAFADVDGDGSNDIIVAQNFNAAQRETGRMNAGLGVIVSFKADKTFSEIWPKNSGFVTRADSRRIVLEDFGNDGNFELLLGQNNGELEVFRSRVNKTP